MSVSMNVLKVTNDNRVLFSEKSGKKNNVVEKFYSVDSDKFDKYTTAQAFAKTHNGLQSTLSVLGSAGIGFLAATKVKAGGLAGRLAIGVAAGVASMFGFSCFDNLMVKHLDSRNKKRYDIKEISPEEINKVDNIDSEKV